MKKVLLLLFILFFCSKTYSQFYRIGAYNGQTVSTCKGQFVASGFVAGDFLGGTNGYGNNENYSVTFCSSAGTQVRANFYWLDLETGYDFLYVYDGPSTASPLIATLNGSTMYPGVYTSSGTCLTFRFVSDGSTRWGGWNALLGCTPQACGANAVASDVCTSAPIICNLNGYCGTTSGWYTRDHGNIEGAPWGGSDVFSCGSIQNNSWISFVASATTASFNITSSQCSDPTIGIQAIVLSSPDCNSFTAKSTCVGNGIGTFALNATALTIGQTYYIMIDGVDGNDCNYTVQATAGVQTVNVTSSASSTLCTGQSFTLNANASGAGPFTYSWSPAPVSGQGTVSANYTASTSATYSVTITGACGATLTATFFQTVSAPPTVSVSGTNTICASGAGTVLTATGTNTTPTLSFSNNNNFNIPDNNATGVTSNISVSGIPGTVGTQLLSVCLNITHGWDGDVSISLRCPSGTTIDLSSNNGGSGDNYTNTCFSTAGTAITAGTAAFTGTFTPEQALSLLSGCTVNGTWSLIVKDNAASDVGTLLNWTLTFSNSLTYTWAPTTGLSPTTGTTVTANPAGTTTYTVTATNYAGCSGTAPYTVTVNPSPIATATPTSQTICSGNVTGIALTSNMGGTTFAWTVVQTNVSGASASSGAAIAQTLTATSTVAGTAVYTITPTSGGCAGLPITVTITVNPKPVVTATPAAQTICSGTAPSIALTSNIGSTTFSWTVVQTNVSGASAGSGATIAQTLTATTASAGTAVYTITPTTGGCPGLPINVTITVNPPPVATATPSLQTICSGNTTGIALTSNLGGTTFAWTIVQTNVSGASAGSGTSIAQTLTATTTVAGTAVYTITPTAGGCPGAPINVTITVNPKPVVTATPASQTICSGTAPSIALTSNVGGTTFAWTVVQTNVSGASAGSGTPIAQTLTATSTVAGTAVYTITPTAGGCAGLPINVTITVNPPPVATATPASQTICSGSITGISLTSSLGSTTFAWTVVQTNVTGASAGSGTSIAQTLTATSTVAGTAVYTITPSASGCPGAPISVTITVNPKPVVTATPTSQTICSGTAPSIALTSNVGGTTFSWTVVQTNVSGASAGSGSTIAQILTATGTTAGSATYTITPLANGCSGNPISVTITVNPTTIATATPTSQTICSGNITGISLSGSVVGTTFTWTVVQTNVSGASAGSGSTIAQTLNATSAVAGTAVYTITPTANSCPGAPITVTITVSPRPAATATPASQTFCTGGTTGIALSSGVGGTTFSWTVVQTGVSGASAGSGSNITQTLSTTGAVAGTAVYTITPTAGGCTGTPISVTINVNPRDNASFTYGSSTYCQTGTNPTPTITGLGGGTFTSVPAGLSINSSTGLINLAASALTTYTVTYTTIGICPNTSSLSITISSAPSASFTYSGSPFCQYGSNPFPIFGVGASAGTFTATPAGLNFVNVNTGQINLSTSTPNTYTITNSIVASGGCSAASATFSVTIAPAPVATATPSSQTICSGSAAGIVLTSSLGGTTYSWTITQTGVTGASAGSGSSITQTLTATGIIAGTAVYSITPTSGGCVGLPINVTITVNPNPIATATPAIQTICSGTAPSIALTSNIAGTTFAWTVIQTNVSGASAASGSNIAQTLTATSAVAGTAVYTITPTASSCAGTSITVTITVNPSPVVTATPASQTICSGSTSGIALTSNVTGTTFSWTVTQTGVTGAANGTGSSIAQALTTTGSVSGTAIYLITPTANGCQSSPISVTITVNPIPTVTATPSTQTICSGGVASTTLSSTVTGTTFAWTVIQTGVSGATAGGGSSITQPLNATGTTSGTAVYTITPTANGCSGFPITFTVTVNPNPDVIATPSAQTICSGTATSIGLTSSVTGTAFSWTVASQVGATGATAGSGSTIAQTLNVTGSSSGTVIYSVTPSANGCSGTPVSVTVTVNPIPFVSASPSPQTICSGTATSINLTSFTAGTTFSWTASNGAGISGATSGTGATISQILNNSLTTTDVATYSITPIAAGCPGLATTVNVNVNPIPTMNPDAQSICSGATTSISLSASVTGTTFTWPAPSQTGATGGTAGSGSSITQTLTATGATSGTVTYIVTPTANSCAGTPATITITVNPNPSATAVPVSSSICSGTTTSIPLSSNVAGTTFTWTATSSGASGESGGSGSNIAQTLSTTGSTSGTVTYNITATTPAGCSSTLTPVVITVNPIPVISAVAVPSTICSGATTAIAISSNVTGTVFSWTVAQTDVTGASAGSGSSISQILTASLATPGTAIYTITSLANSCAGNTEIISIIVNPIPTVTASPASQSICNGSSTLINLSSNVSGAILNWTESSSGTTGAFPGSGNTIIQSLSLTGTVAGNVVYTITPTANGCSGISTDVTITVNPIDDPSFTYAGSTFCQTGSDPSPTITGGLSGIFSSTPSGLVFIDTTTGQIDVSASSLGNYSITFTTNGLCPNNSTVNINITIAPDATFSYATPFCQLGMAFPVFLPNSSAGLFSSIPVGVTFVNTSTGQIDLANSLPGTYSITNFIAASGGCAPATYTTNLVIDPSATVNAGVDTSICEGTNYSLAGIMSGSASSIVWSTNGSGTFNDPTNLGAIYSPSLADISNGIVTLTITSNDPTGVCNAAIDNLNLTITPSDNATFNYTDTTFCQSGVNPIPTITGLAGGIFSSSVGLTFVSTSTGEINLTASTAGSYSVYYTTNGTCPKTDTANLTITPTPISTFSFTSNATSFCQSDPNPSPVFGSGAFAGTFSSSPVGLIFISTITGEIDLLNSAPGTYTVTNTIAAANGCATSIDSLIISINLPATTNAGSDGTICSGQTYTISGAAIGGSALSSTWTTSGSGTFDNSAILGATYTPSNADITAGSVTLTITTDDPAGVCGAVTDNLVLTINTTPPPPTVSSNTITACSGVSVSAIVATGTGGTITWYSDAALSNVIGTGNSYTPGVLTGSTSYWVTETSGVCQSNSTQIDITINPLPVADTTAVIVTPANCGSTTGTIVGITMTSGQTPFTYLWQDAGLNNVGNGANLTNVGAGLYTLTITDGNGCSATVGPFTVTSSLGVVSDFSANPITGETPLSVDFTNTSTGATNYVWQFGTGATSTAVNPTYVYIPLGNFTVCLIADNGAGCVDTSCATIDVYINSTFVIPNVFTPNDDNVNDVFAVQNKGLETMDAEIFNRWGEKMFEWHTTNGGWDGRTTSGILAPEGTYYYIIKATGIDGKEYFEKGGFTLMR